MWHGGIAEHPGTSPAGRGPRGAGLVVDLILLGLAPSAWLLLRNEVVADRVLNSTRLLLGIYAAGALPALAVLALNIHRLLTRGQTLGKAAFSIRIVDAKRGERVGFVRLILVRGLLNGVLCLVPGYLLVDVLYIFRKDRRCLHDRLARTRVVPAPELRPRWRILDRIVVVVCILVALVTAGIALTARRTISIAGPVVRVGVEWPGANVLETERRVTAPLEARGGEVPGVAGTRSRTSAGRSVVELSFPTGFDPQLALERTRKTFDESPPGLPAAAEEMTLRLTGGRELVLVLTGDADRSTLSSFARQAAEVIVREPGVRHLEILGADTPGLVVAIDESRLMAIGISAEAILGAVRESSGVEGVPDDLGDVPLDETPDGAPVLLRDVAGVEAVDLREDHRAWIRDRPAVILRVELGPGADEEALHERVATIASEAPPPVVLSSWEGNEDGGRILIHLRPSPFDGIREAAANAPRLAHALVWTEGRFEHGITVLVPARTMDEARALAGVLEDDRSRISRVSTSGEIGSSLTVRVLTDDPVRLAEAADGVCRMLAEVAGVAGAWCETAPVVESWELVPDPGKLGRIGLDEDVLARHVALHGVGLRAGTVADRPVLVRIGDGDPGRLDPARILLPTRVGAIPLSEVATLVRTESPAWIEHRDGRRVISVTALVAPGEIRRRVVARAREALAGWSYDGLELCWD